MRRSRRGAIALGLTAVLLALQGCTASATGTTAQASDYKVEVFSWWSGQGEREGLEALIDDFKRIHPGIEFVDEAVGGGVGGNARAVLTTRLQANDPPDSYQVHAGMELAGDVKAGELEDLTGLFEREGWQNKFPKAVLDAVTVGGRIYAVPLDVHRSNLIWYNPDVLSRAGIGGPPKTWDEFLTQTSVLKARGVVPIALGPEWTQKQLLETVLLGELGPEAYTGLWNGKTDWNSGRVTAALTTYARVLANSDVKAASGDWQPMMDKVTSGAAAYAVMGDWASGYLSGVKKLTYQRDFGVVASPGTAEVYDFTADSFTLPRDAPHRSAAEKWLVECGSVTAQDLFSQVKGALPARLDTRQSVYTGYSAVALKDWQDPNTKIVGSLTHGAVANTAWNSEIDTALARFVDDADPFTFSDTVMKAYQATRS